MQLSNAGYDYEVLQRERDWPRNDCNIALCSMHSAKGLEFDHVFLLGLNAETLPHGHEDTVNDTDLQHLRRLLAMAVGRAKKTVTIGHKPGEESSLAQFFKPGTYRAVTL